MGSLRIRAGVRHGLAALALLALLVTAGAPTVAQDTPTDEDSILLDPVEAQALWDQALETQPLGRVGVEYTSPATECTGMVTSVAYRLTMPRGVTLKLTVHCDGGCEGVDCAMVTGCTPVGLTCAPATCADALCSPWCERTISTPKAFGAQ